MDSTILERHNRSLGSVFNRTRNDKISQTLRTLTIVAPDGSPKVMPFSEYQGPVPPTPELGRPGDIYIDTTPSRQALYARYDSEWKKWVGPQNSNHLSHPDYPHRFLLCLLNPPNVGWYAQRMLSTLRTGDLSSEPSEIISVVLAQQAEDSQSKSVLGKRKHKAHIQVPTSTTENVPALSQSRDRCPVTVTPGSLVGPNPLPSPSASLRASAYSPTQLPDTQWLQNKRQKGITTATASSPQNVADRIPFVRGATTASLPGTQSVPQAQSRTLASLTTHTTRDSPLLSPTNVAPSPLTSLTTHDSPLLSPTKVASNLLPSVTVSTPLKPQKDWIISPTESTIESEDLSEDIRFLEQEIAQMNAKIEVLRKRLNGGNLPVQGSQTPLTTESPVKAMFNKNLSPEQVDKAHQMNSTAQLQNPQDKGSFIPSRTPTSQSPNILQQLDKTPIEKKGNNVSPMPSHPPSERISTNSPRVIRLTTEKKETPPISPLSPRNPELHRNSLSASKTLYAISSSPSRGSETAIQHASRDTTVVGSPEVDFKRKLSITSPSSLEITPKVTNSNLIEIEATKLDHETMPQTNLHLDENHTSIIFHQSGKESICRVCLMTTPRRVWKLMNKSPSTGLIKHCEEEHAVFCETLVKLGVDQLSDIKQQLSRGTASKA